MRRLLRLGLACALLSLGPAATSAQESPSSAPRSSQGYEGVAPGSGHAPPATQRLSRRTTRRGAPVQILTWPGFQMLPDGSSRFFVQTTGEVAAELRTLADRVEVRFPNTTIHLANSARWLETRHFDTPVRRARLERRGRDMVLVMHMRAAATPRLSSGAGEGGEGFRFTFVDFPPGDYLPAEPERPATPGGSVGFVSGRSGSASGDEGAPSAPAEGPPGADEERPPALRGPAPKR